MSAAKLPMDAQRWERALGDLLACAPRGLRFVAVTWPDGDPIERSQAIKKLRDAAAALERDTAQRLLGIYPGGRFKT